MAKIKKITKKINPWLENRIVRIRNLSQHQAARAARKYAGLAGVVAILTATLVPLFLPKNQFQILKERLVKNQNDFEAHLQLAENFLENNQLEEAERALLLAQKISNSKLVISNSENKVLGEKSASKLNELWQRKHYSDPKDIKRLISTWEKIVEEKPNYRDGYFQLAYLYYKIYENDKAEEYLEKALELDPNYEPARELERILGH